MKTILYTADSRGHVNHGWLDAHHSFSFGNYYDASRVHFGMLRVLNDDIVQGGMGFGTHPHDNMEIITIPLTGALEHKDSTGGHGVIKQYDVQVMSAGTGLYHSEFNHSKTDFVNLLQVWIFPKEKNIKPRYDQKTFLPTERENKLQTVVAPDNAEALYVHQDTWFSLGKFEAGKTTDYNINKKGNGVYLFVTEGSVTVGEQQLNKRDALGIYDTDTISITATTDAEYLLIDVPMN